MRLLAAAFLLVGLLAGCAERRDSGHIGPDRVDNVDALDKVCIMPAQVFDEVANGHFVYLGVQNTGGGSNFHFKWSWDESRLSNVSLHVTWTPKAPTTEELSARVFVFDDNRPWEEQPMAQGRSPVDLGLGLEDVRILTDPHIDFGGPQHFTAPSASATVIDQPVEVTIQETYRCSESVHPDDIMPSA